MKMSQSLDLFVLSCLFFMVHSKRDQVLQPQNVSLRWKSDFEPELSWAPVENCTYEVFHLTSIYTVKVNTWSEYTVMEGGLLKLSVSTVCDGVSSEPAIFNETYPELVRSWTCYIQSSKKTHCNWLPARRGSDLRFFYRLIEEDHTTPDNSDVIPPLLECSAYTHTDGIRTGCDLQAKISQDIHILFNDTQDNMPVRNTFKLNLLSHVKLDPLMLKATKIGNDVSIPLNPPDILSDWVFIIHYTECNDKKFKTAENKVSFEMELRPQCPYCFTIEAKWDNHVTPLSNEQCFDAVADPSAWVFAAIIIPLVCTCFAALTFMCFKKNKDIIFPKVPVPRDFLSDISNNNNKSNLYIPGVEDDNCKITLVIDPQNNKQYSGNP